MKYKLNIPMYFYNTGRADNGSRIKEITYPDLETAIEARDWLNNVWENKLWETEDETITKRIHEEFLEWEGFQEQLAYVTQISTTIIK